MTERKYFEEDSRTVAKDGAMIIQFMVTLNLFISVLKPIAISLICGHFLKIKCKFFEENSRTVSKDGAMICQFMETLNLFISVLKH
jgi:hypothetical protein